MALRKAAGPDGIWPEFLKCGGESSDEKRGTRNRMAEVLCGLFNVVWKAERTPRLWKESVTVPVFKKGDRLDPEDYRPISLTSCVAKVYESALTHRLTLWLEANGRIPEEQGGFRWWRGCPELIYLLREVTDVAREEGMPVFSAFLDTRKAYDTVWRDGLWTKLWDEGVQGKMWRAMRESYEGTAARVRVGDRISRPFSTVAGVRQGSVASPVLYSVFINGLVKEMKRLGLGLTLGGVYVGCMLFADDVAFLAASAAELRLMLEAYERYARSWRFQPNVGKSKVVVFPPAVVPEEPFELWGGQLEVVAEFKYLGVERQADGKWGSVCTRLLASAKRASGFLNALGLGHFHVRPKTGDHLWKSLIRPIVDWGAEVVTPSAKAMQALEVFQRSVGKKILGCPSRTPTAVVHGELGWMSMARRRDVLRLRFLRHLALMSEGRSVRRFFLFCKGRFDEGRRAGRRLRTSWCGETFAALQRLGLERFWEERLWESDEFVGKGEWAATLDEAAAGAEHLAWRAGMDGKSSLDLYRAIKEEVGREPFLECEPADNRAAALRVGLRGGVHELEVSAARLVRSGAGGRVLPAREERLCRVCDGGVPEDAPHFLLKCEAIAGARCEVFGRLEAAGMPPGLADADVVRLLLGAPKAADGSRLGTSKELDLAAMRGVLCLSKARRRVLYPPAGGKASAGEESD